MEYAASNSWLLLCVTCEGPAISNFSRKESTRGVRLALLARGLFSHDLATCNVRATGTFARGAEEWITNVGKKSLNKWK